jgi:hypothetical protein
MTVQYCVACNNEDPTHIDGGGFDIDSGSNNKIRYCYSKNNVGPGILIRIDLQDGQLVITGKDIINNVLLA